MTTCASNFASAKEVSAAITTIGFQASAETLGAISRNCRDEFLDHLSKCVTGQDTDGASKKVIETLLRCLSPDTVHRLQNIVLGVTVDMIVPVARKAPARLLSALDAASDVQHARHEDAKAFLESVFMPPPPAAAAPHTPPVNPAMRPAPSSPAPASSADQTTQAAADQKQYKSCHVYGSTYALCFNADTWEGKPGVMVDAAFSNGLKSYDWKNATHIWLDVNEVGAVLAVFRRWRKSVEFSAHGAQNDKSFSIEFQDQHFFAKLMAKKAPQHPARAVKILPNDATAVSILFLTQLAAAYPNIPLNELLATVRAAHTISNAAAA